LPPASLVSPTATAAAAAASSSAHASTGSSARTMSLADLEDPVGLQASVLLDCLRVWFARDHAELAARLLRNGHDAAAVLLRIRTHFEYCDRAASVELLTAAFELMLSNAFSQSKTVAGPALLVSEFMFVQNFDMFAADSLFAAAESHKQARAAAAAAATAAVRSSETVPAAVIDGAKSTSSLAPASTVETAEAATLVSPIRRATSTTTFSTHDAHSQSSWSLMQVLLAVPHEGHFQPEHVRSIYDLFQMRWTDVFAKYRRLRRAQAEAAATRDAASAANSGTSTPIRGSAAVASSSSTFTFDASSSAAIPSTPASSSSLPTLLSPSTPANASASASASANDLSIPLSKRTLLLSDLDHPIELQANVFLEVIRVWVFRTQPEWRRRLAAVGQYVCCFILLATECTHKESRTRET
jgi:hypothetical protein